jgi:hypothetical protein
LQDDASTALKDEKAWSQASNRQPGPKKETPFGPFLKMRSSPEELIQQLSFAPKGLFEVSDYFYMQLFVNI